MFKDFFPDANWFCIFLLLIAACRIIFFCVSTSSMSKKIEMWKDFKWIYNDMNQVCGRQSNRKMLVIGMNRNKEVVHFDLKCTKINQQILIEILRKRQWATTVNRLCGKSLPFAINSFWMKKASFKSAANDIRMLCTEDPHKISNDEQKRFNIFRNFLFLSFHPISKVGIIRSVRQCFLILMHSNFISQWKRMKLWLLNRAMAFSVIFLPYADHLSRHSESISIIYLRFSSLCSLSLRWSFHFFSTGKSTFDWCQFTK